MRATRIFLDVWIACGYIALMGKKRRKPAAQRKEITIRIRVTVEQEKVLKEAAAKKALDLSSWLRSLGIEAAKKAGAE